MYCSHCGAQIPDDSAFCPSCGQKPGRAGDPAAQTAAPQSAPPPQTSYAQPAPRYVETIKSEGEFIQEYRNLHNYGTYKTGQTIFKVGEPIFLIGYLIWVFVDVNERFGQWWSRSATWDDYFAYLPVPLVVIVVCGIFEYLLSKRVNDIDSTAASEYRRYKRKMGIGGIQSSSSIFSDSNSKNLDYSSKANPPRTSIPANGWRCPDCGRVNASYVGTCACGRRKNS